jgi:hypothetical protein
MSVTAGPITKMFAWGEEDRGRYVRGPTDRVADRSRIFMKFFLGGFVRDGRLRYSVALHLSQDSAAATE